MPLFTDGFYEQSTIEDAPGYSPPASSSVGDGTSSFGKLLTGGISVLKDLGTAYLSGRQTLAEIERTEADADAKRSQTNATNNATDGGAFGGIDQKTLLIGGAVVLGVVVLVVLVKK